MKMDIYGMEEEEMVKELVIEMVVFVVLQIAAFAAGWMKVKFIDRPAVIKDNECIIAPPRRKHIKSAKKLNAIFADANKNARIESESLIVLPSESFAWTFGLIAGAIMTYLLLHNHIDGIIQTIISTDAEYPLGFICAVFGVAVIGMVVAGWIAEEVIPHAAHKRAKLIGIKRIRKGRTARFSQALSLDEAAAAAKWATKEQLAQKRMATRHSN